jgi:hypothetical protein
MDGNVQFEREAATDVLDEALHLQAFYERSDGYRQTETVATTHSSQSSSDPRLDETRAMATAP